MSGPFRRTFTRIAVVALLVAMGATAVRPAWAATHALAAAANPAADPARDAAGADPPLSIWRVARTLNPGASMVTSDFFNGVPAASATDAWAVGTGQCCLSQPPQPLAEHWNGRAWIPVVAAKPAGSGPSSFNGVDELSPTDAWAVGVTQAAQGGRQRTLIEHWNGAAWSIVASPNPAGGTSGTDLLNAIAGVGPNDLWAVGWDSNGITTDLLFAHWDGTRWSAVDSLSLPGFGEAVTAVSSTDVWAVGNDDIGGQPHTLAAHWDGHAWSLVPTPNLFSGRTPQNFLTGVSQAGANDVWASGYQIASGPISNLFTPYLLHWDGTAWTLDRVPNAGNEGGLLRATTALSANNVWAVGQIQESDGALLSLTEHFDGSAWTIVPSPDPGQLFSTPDNTLSGAASITRGTGGAVFAVGSQEIPGQCCLRTLALEALGAPATATPAADGAALAPNSSALLAWGDNSAGELGDGNAIQSDVPVSVTSPGPVAVIAAGGRHNLALLTNGTVMAWGDNTFDQLGDGAPGPNHDSGTPVPVAGLRGVTAVSSGGEHSLALLSNGTVMAWGANFDGQLGDGTTTDSAVPVTVTGLSGVVAISAGYLHNLALLKNGTVMAWGYNGDGQLGNGTFVNSNVPVAVTGLSGVTAVAAGGLHSLALLKNGTMMAWGDNESGQLGDGRTAASSTVPVAVTGLSGATAIAAGDEHSVALLATGAVMAWGDNGFGELGNGTFNSSTVPVTVPGLGGVTAVSAGGLFNLALLANGTVMAWGDYAFGQLGTGDTTTPNSMPVPVPDLSGVTAVSAGAVHSLVATAGA